MATVLPTSQICLMLALSSFKFFGLYLRVLIQSSMSYSFANLRDTVPHMVQEQRRSGEDFSDVILTDECAVQLEQHSSICFDKKYQPRV